MYFFQYATGSHNRFYLPNPQAFAIHTVEYSQSQAIILF